MPLLTSMWRYLDGPDTAGVALGVAAWTGAMTILHAGLKDVEARWLTRAATALMGVLWAAWWLLPEIALLVFYGVAARLAAAAVHALPVGPVPGELAFAYTLGCGAQTFGILGVWWWCRRLLHPAPARH